MNYDPIVLNGLFNNNGYEAPAENPFVKTSSSK